MAVPDRTVRVLRGHSGPVLRVRWSSKGNYCLTAGSDRSVRLWNPHRDDDDPAAQRTGFDAGARASGSGGAGGSARSSSVPSAMLIKTYDGAHGYDVHDVAITADNAAFASCGGDKPVFLWDVSTARVVRKLFGHEHRVNSVAFAGDGQVLISGSYDTTVRCWDCRSRSSTPIQVMSEAGDSIGSVAAVGSDIIASSVDGHVRTYDVRAGRLRKDALGDPVVSISISNDEKCILGSCLSGEGRIRLLERSSGLLLQDYAGHKNISYAIDCCFTATDAQVVSGSEDGSVVCWDLVEATVVNRLSGHGRAVCSVAHHPKDPWLLSASYDGTARLWGPGAGATQ